MDTLWPRLRTAAALLFGALLTVMWLQPGTRAVDLPLDNLPIRLQVAGALDAFVAEAEERHGEQSKP